MDKELESYRSQLASNPDDAEALARLEAALLRASDWDGLVALTAERSQGLPEDEVSAAWVRLVEGLSAFAAELEDPAEISRVAVVTARICEDRLGALEEAMIRYQQAFQLDASNLDALAQARRIYADAGRFDMVLQLWNLEVASLSEPRAQADVYLRMADVCLRQLDRRADAVVCVRQALKLVPDHPGAENFVELLSDVRENRRARVDELIAEAEAARDPRQRSALLVEAAGLWLEEAPEDDAIEALLRSVIERDPRNEPARILLEQFFEVNGHWDRLMLWLEERAEATARKGDRQAIYQQLAEVAESQLGDEGLALQWHRKVLELSPVEPASLNFCVDVYSGSEAWEELVQVYEAAVRVRHRAGDEAPMLVQIAMILWKKLADLDGAEGYFRRIKLNDPKNGLMLSFYVDYYRTKDDAKRLLATLGAQQQAATSHADKVAIALEMARVAEADSGNLQKAVDVWKSLLKLQNDHPEGRAALRRLYTETGKWNALLEFVKEDLDLTPKADRDARIAIYAQLIEIYRDRMKLPRMVMSTYNDLLEEDPGNRDALDALEASFEARSKWNDLIGVLERRAEFAADAAERVALQKRIAELWLDKFSNPTKAKEALEAVLAADPEDGDALDRLVEIYRQRKDWRALFDAYQRRLGGLSGAPRVALLAEMAAIAEERLDAPDDAVALWRQVLVAEPDRDDARAALEALLRAQGAWSSLATQYRERLARTSGVDQLPWLRQLATLLAVQVGDTGAAAELWQAALAIDPGDVEAERALREYHLALQDWDALEALYLERDEPEALARVLRQATDEAPDAETRVELLRRLAAVSAGALGDQAAAMAAWERVLREDPESVDAARQLAPHYGEVGAWAEQVAVLEVILAAGPADPVAVMGQLAQIHQERLGRPDAAWPWRARALEAAPTDAGLLAAAVQTAESAGLEAELADHLTALLGTVEGAAALPLQRAFARVCAEALGRPEEAARAYEAIRAAAGDEPGVISALEDLYRRLEDWDALAAIYARRLEAAASVEEKCAILAAVGELQENVRDDHEAARAAYAQILELDARNLDALRGLQRLARQSDDAEALAGYLEAELALARDPAARAGIRARLARLADDAGDTEEALVHLGEALASAPGHRESVAHLTAMLDGPSGPQAAAVLEPELRRAEDWDGLRRALALQVEGEPAHRTRLLREVAEVEEQRLADPAAAFATWQRVLVEAPGDAGVRAELERLAEALGAFDELAGHYARFAVGGSFAADDPEGALAYSRILAHLQEHRLGQPAAARATLEALAVEQGDDATVLDALDRLATRLEDWRGLVDIGERRLALLEDEDARRELFVRIGDLWEEVLEDPEQAAGVYRRLLAEHPDERAFRALDRILRRLKRWGELAELQRGRLLELSGEPARALAMELAELLKDELAAPQEAVEVLAAVLDDDPTDEAASDALQLMLIEHDGADDRPLRQRLCEVLQPVYAARGDWQSSVAILQARLEDEASPAERAALGVQVAVLYEEQAGDKRAAFASYGQAFGETWTDPDILAALERLAEELGAFTDLAWHLRRGLEADDGADPATRLDLLRRVAVIYEERAGDLEQAVEFNQRLLAEEPNDADALVRLDGLYQRTGDLAALAGVIEQRALHADDRDALLTQLFRLGALLEEQLDDAPRAVAVYRQIRGEAEPGDVRAHVALERLLGAAGEWEALVEVLIDHAEATEEVPAKRALLRQAAEALESGLDRPGHAADLYRQIVALDEADVDALRQLDRLLVRLEQPIELLEVLEAQRDLAEGPARADLELRIGKLLHGALGEPGRAVEAFRAALAARPGDAAAQAALEGLLDEPEVRLEAGTLLAELHAAAGRHAALRDVLRRTLDDHEDLAEQVATLERIAALEEGPLGDAGAAFEALAEAWRRDEAGERLEPELLRVADAAGRIPALVDLYVELAPLAERAEALRLQAARLAETRLGDAERAAAQLQEVLRLDPENAEALSGLERLLARTGDAEALAEVLDRKVELADSDAERRSLLVRLADLQESLLDDPTAAIETWRRVLADTEDDAAALGALERLLAGQGRWPEVAALLDHRVSVEEAPAAVELRLAQVLEQHLGEGERALELYRAVLEAEPANADARRALAALFGDEERAMGLGLDRRAIAVVLEPAIRQEGDAAQLVAVLDVLQAGAFDDPDEQAKRLEEIAHLRESALGQPEAAFDARGRLLRIAPENAANRAELMRLAGAAYRWDGLAALLEDVAAELLDPTLKVELLLALGRIEESHRGQDGRAVAVYRDALAVDPECEAAVDALVELFGRNASWDELVRLHLDRAEVATDPEAQKELYFKACQLLEEVVADRDRAIAVYRQVLVVDPDDARARDALRRFFRQDGRWEDLVDLLREEIEGADDAAARAALGMRLAEVLETRLDDLDGAITTWQGIVEDGDAGQAQAVEALERVLIELADEDPEDPRRRRVAEILEPIYTEAGQWSDQVLAMEVRLSFEEDRWQRLETLGAIAEVQEKKLEDGPAAFAAWARAFGEDPGSADVRAAMQRLAASLGAWNALAEAFAAGVARAEDPDTALELLAEVGRIQEVELGQPAAAIETWRRVLGVDEGSSAALDALERLLEATGDATGLVEVLARKADLADEPDDRRRLRYRIGELQETVVGDGDAAIAAWRQVFDEDPEDATAIAALIRLYEAGSHWPMLVEMLREQYELAADDAAGKAVLVRIAAVQEGPLEAVDDAIMTWRTVAEADPRDADAFEALNRLLTREERWGELIDLLEAEREADGVSPEQSDALALRVAEILAERLGQQAQVIEIHGDILERAEQAGGGGAAAEQARLALEALLTDPEHRLAASRVLEGWYARREAWSALARILDLQIADTDDRMDRLELLKRLGALQHATLGKGREAFDTYGRALAEDPHEGDVLTALETITEDLGLHPELADLLEARVSEVMDASVALELHRRLARLVDQQLGVPVRAIAAWQAVLQTEPFDAEALAALERLYTQEEDWPALIGTLRRRIEEGSAENLPDLQCKLGYLLEAVEGDGATALELYRAVLWDHPAHPVALPSVERLAGDLTHRRAVAEILEPLYRDAGEWAKLALLTEMRIELADEAHERARLWLQSAELRDEQLHDPASAFAAALQGFAEAPGLEEVRERVLALGTAQGEWPRLVAAFELGIEAVDDPDVQLEDHLRIAAWSAEHLGDTARAVLHYEAALALEPEHSGALDALEAIHRAAGDWAALAAVVARRAELAFDLDVRRARLMELGTLRAERLGDAAGAATAWTGVLALEETDAEALAALEKLYTAHAQWAELCAILQRQAESTYDEDPLVALHMRIGDLAMARLADGQRAALAFERVLEIRPDDAEAIRRLRDLYTDQGAWLQLQEVLLKALAAADDDEAARADVLIALGRNADEHLERPEVAAEHYRQALIVRPADAAITDRLAVLFRKAERWFELVEVLREHLEAVRDEATPARRVELLVAIAEVAQGRLFDADLAIECLNEVLATDPAHGRARLVLAGLYEKAGDWDKAAEALEKVAVDATTAADRGAAWRQLGLLYRDHLDRPEAALQALERAVTESEDEAAVAALVDLARAEGDDARLAQLLALQLKPMEGVARAPVLRELAKVRARVGDEAGRIDALQEARSLAPDDLEVADALVEALVAAGRLDEAEPLLQGLIDDLKANRRFRDLFRFNFRLGNVAEARGNEDQALEAYTACFEFDATWLPNLMKLGRLHYRRSDWNNALRVFQTALLHQMKLERDERAELFYHLGQIRLALDEPRKAKDMFTRALSQVPDHGPSREALEKL